MPCEYFKTKDGSFSGVICHSRRLGRKLCKFCRQPYREGKLCDYPIAEGKTCDAEMCGSCARTLGRQDTEMGGGLIRPNDSIDVCPDHRGKVVMKEGKLEPEQRSLFA